MVDDSIVTATQYKLLTHLADGCSHPAARLRTLLNDELSVTALKVHICNLRKLLPRGQDISCERIGGESFYRIVRRLNHG